MPRKQTATATAPPPERKTRKKAPAPAGSTQAPMLLDITTPLTVVDVKRIRPSPFQTRIGGPAESFTQAIADDGMQDPPTVRPVAESKDFPGCDLEMVKGHQRLGAIIQNGGTEIPVYIREMDDITAYRQHVIENLQRQDLNPIEEARAFDLAQKRFDWSQAKIASTFHRSPAYVKERLELLDLPEEVGALVNDGLPLNKAHALAPLGQFKRMKGGGPDIIAKLDRGDIDQTPARDIDRLVRDTIQRNAVPVRGWDPELCRSKGCLGEFGKKAYCMRPMHAFEVAAAMLAEAMEKAKAKALADKGIAGDDAGALPVYYDLDGIRPRKDNWDNKGLVSGQPKGYPALPLPVFDREHDYNARDSQKYARPLTDIKKDAKAADFTACLTCPAFNGSGKQSQARALYVRVIHDRYRTGAPAVVAQIVCLSFVSRKKKLPTKALGSRGDLYSGGVSTRHSAKGPSPVAIARGHAQPAMKQHVERLAAKLAEDESRLLAAMMTSRYRLIDTPHLLGEYKAAQERLGINVPAHDGTANGILKSVMAIGVKNLRRIAALAILEHTDKAYESGYQRPGEWYPKRLAGTADLLFGDAAGEEIKANWSSPCPSGDPGSASEDEDGD